MLVRMSFTITMSIFWAGLICCFMFGCNDRLAASPVETEIRCSSRGMHLLYEVALKHQREHKIRTYALGL